MLHVATPAGPTIVVVTAQVKSTVAVNEPTGDTVMVDVLPVVVPCVMVRLVGLAVRPKLAVTEDPVTTASTAVV